MYTCLWFLINAIHGLLYRRIPTIRNLKDPERFQYRSVFDDLCAVGKLSFSAFLRRRDPQKWISVLDDFCAVGKLSFSAFLRRRDHQTRIYMEMVMSRSNFGGGVCPVQ